MTTREVIEKAFADVPYPGDDNIADHEPCPECDDVRAFFRGKSWHDLRFPELREFHESLPLLTSEAFHYFLPGYMVACLDHWDQADMIPYSIIRIGGYRDDAWNVKDEARKNRRNFTAAQRDAIAAWLQDISQTPEQAYDKEQVDYAIQQILND